MKIIELSIILTFKLGKTLPINIDRIINMWAPSLARPGSLAIIPLITHANPRPNNPASHPKRRWLFLNNSRVPLMKPNLHLTWALRTSPKTRCIFQTSET